MNHQKINQLVEGDPPSVELKIERDGLVVALRIGVSDFASLPVHLAPWQKNIDHLFQDCNRVILQLLPEVYDKALSIHDQFGKELGLCARNLRESLDISKFSETPNARIEVRGGEDSQKTD